VTTVVDMPLNSIPATTSVEALELKARAVAPNSMVDYGFWGGVVPGNVREIGPMLDAGACGFKCFLVDSGVPEFPTVSETDLREVMPHLAARGAVLLAHAELPGPIARAGCGLPASGSRRYGDFLASRPKAAENEAIGMLIALAREYRGRVHIVHLSSAEAPPALARARREGVPITVETCPHYLCLDAESIPDGRTEFKCCPPVREQENRHALWQGLRDGIIDLVVSDHSPSLPAMKRADTGDFLAAWGGIASLQISLRAVWTEARRRGFGLEHIARWMCAEPARLAGLADRKGRIRPGADADLVIFEPESESPIEPSALHHRHKLTPYAGRTLAGAVRTTILRGRVVYDRGAFQAGVQGQWLRPSPT
jgi:allantoinase